MTVRELHRRFVIIAVSLLIVCAACAIYLLLPSSRSTETKREAVRDARNQVSSLEGEVAPLRHLDQKLAVSNRVSAQFFQQDLPQRYSTISETLNSIARAHNVVLSGVTYTSEDTDLAGLQQITMHATLTGDYQQVMQYIDAMDHSKMFILLDDVGIAPSQQSEQISLTLTMQTFLHTGPLA